MGQAPCFCQGIRLFITLHPEVRWDPVDLQLIPRPLPLPENGLPQVPQGRSLYKGGGGLPMPNTNGSAGPRRPLSCKAHAYSMQIPAHCKALWPTGSCCWSTGVNSPSNVVGELPSCLVRHRLSLANQGRPLPPPAPPTNPQQTMCVEWDAGRPSGNNTRARGARTGLGVSEVRALVRIEHVPTSGMAISPPPPPPRMTK